MSRGLCLGVLLLLITALAPLAVVAAEAKDYPGVLPKPLFGTPGRAAYCYVTLTTLDDLAAKLRCWTPNDGFAASIGWRSNRAETAYYTTRPQIVHSLGVLKGYAPKAPVLRFGKRYRIRCIDPLDVRMCATAAAGELTFSCVSRRTGLTCTNTRGHGFWLGRFKGYRLF